MFITMDKLPIFPHSKALNIDDKPVIESFVAKHPPYSDFNFTSMFSWDSRSEYRISNLNNNLVVRFTDYITGEPFYSCLGEDKIDETLHKLIEQSEIEGIAPRLHLIPHTVIDSLENKSVFNINEDRSNFDYIYSIPESTTLEGTKYQNHRRYKRKFKDAIDNEPHIDLIDVTEKNNQSALLSLFETWRSNSNQNIEESGQELEAIKKKIDHASYLDVHCIGVYVKNEIIAFSLNEITHDNYAITHFEKADTSYHGVFYFLRHETNKILEDYGCTLLNLEQDLGIETLRMSKESHRPIDFLKKYTVELS